MPTLTEASPTPIVSISARRRIRDNQRLRTLFLKASQFLTWPISLVFFRMVYRLDVRGRENFRKVSSPFILISNHVNAWDSFVFRVILGFSTPHLPLRFMAVRDFAWPWLNLLAKIGFIDFVYSIFGVFTVVPGRGLAKNLEEAKRILKAGGNVVIYPEGTLEIRNMISPFRPGASVLAQETGAPVVPISFRIGRRKWFRTKMTVNVGEPIKADPKISVKEVTRLFYDTIGELYDHK